MSVLQTNTGRRIGVTKLIIDPGLPTKNGNRNLIIGVPQQCQTVGEFKRHFSSNYLGVDTTVDFWVDKFCIPDEEDSTLFSVLSEPIRVLPLTADEVDKKATPSITAPPSAIVSSLGTPPANSKKLEVENPSSKISKRVKFDSSIVPFSNDRTGSTNRNEISAVRNVELTPSLTQPQESERKLTSSAKRRKRLRKSLENKLASVSQTDNEITSPSEARDVEQIRQSAKKSKTQSLVLETIAEIDKVRLSEEAKKTSAVTKEKTNGRPSWERPRMPKSFKNPAALEIFKRFDFCADKDHSITAPRRANPLNLKDTFMQVADNLAKSSIETDASTQKPGKPVQLTTEMEYETSDAPDGFVAGAHVAEAGGPLDSQVYEKLPLLLSSDDVSENCIIAFKVTEMGEDYQPVVSDFKEATVTGKSVEGALTLEYLKSCSVVRSGKFEVEGYESEGTENPTRIHFSRLIEPRLVRSGSSHSSPGVNGSFSRSHDVVL